MNSMGQDKDSDNNGGCKILLAPWLLPPRTAPDIGSTLFQKS